MKYMDIQNVSTGMILGEDIHDDNGIMLYTKNTLIDKDILLKIKQLGIELVLIEDEKTALKYILEERNKIIELVYDTISNLYFYNKDYYSIIKTSSLVSFEKVLVEDKSIDILSGLYKIDEYSFFHAVRTAMLSALISKWQELEDDMVEKCFFAGLFHQAGKIKIERNMLIKREPLTNEELKTVKKYINYSEEVLDGLSFIDSDVMLGIVQSMERIDGSGYPEGFQGVAIHPIAKIVAVANIFDAATSDKCYKKAISLFDISDFLFEESLEKLSPKSTAPLIKAIESTYMGTKVELSNGKIGEIIFINKFDSRKPLVKIDNEIIDLSKQKNKIDIVKFLN